MKVIIHFPQQVKIIGLHRYAKILRNGQQLKSLKESRTLSTQMNKSDEVQIKLGYIKSNSIMIQKETELYIELSRLLRYETVILVACLLGSTIINSFVIWELKHLLISLTIHGALIFMWTLIVLKGNHLRIKTPLKTNG
jgi:hypothetical protein